MSNVNKSQRGSSISIATSKISDVPDAPTIGAVTDTAAGGTVTVAYTAAATGGAVTTFTATSTPGTITGTGASPITVTGLTDSTAYTFKVKGTNSTATGPESAASTSVTPTSPPGDFESIATVSVGSGGSSSISFTSIPATYNHLQIRAIIATSAGDAILGTFNSDTGANYSRHRLVGNGSGTSAASGTSNTSFAISSSLGFLSTANTFGPMVLDILDFANTYKYKTIRSLSGYENNTTGTVEFDSGLWMSTTAVTSVTLVSYSGTILQYSHFALYGLKG